MRSQLDFNPKRHIFSCPFSESCNLPKSESLYSFPENKICPDYQSKLTLLKNSKALH